MDPNDEADRSDEDVFFDDSDESEGEEFVECLDTILKSKTIKLPIRSTYVSGWRPEEAFRELVQNWRDGIIKSSGIKEDEFTVIREECHRGRNVEIVLKVLRPNSEPKDWLGFIRFKGSSVRPKDQNEVNPTMGTIEITNRNATLQPWHLDMGGTSKTGDQNQAGAHGEGLKLALLILQRTPQNHCVRCFSGGFRWNFNFTTEGRLVTRLRRMTPREIERTNKAATLSSTRGIAPFAPSPTKDVQFFIGQKASGRNQVGIQVRRQQVSLQDFNSWCKIAMFLQDFQPDLDKQVVQVNSKSGDLLLSDELRGNLYLKGLLLQASHATASASITGQPLKYGYNFRYGTVNRERESMASARVEGTQILAIWELVLRRQPLFIADLSDMLNTTEPKYADVAMAKEAMKAGTVMRLQEHLFEDQSKWYYSASEKEKNPQLKNIIESLDREGVQLTDKYWEILKKHTPALRTAEEEQRRLFLAASVIVLPKGRFSQEINRMMQACLRACPQTAQVKLEFVKAGRLSIQTLYLPDENSFKVHERWLDQSQAVQELGLRQTLNEFDALLHTVKYLFHEILTQVPVEDFLSEDDGRTKTWHKRRQMSLAEQSIMDYLRMKKYIEHFVHAQSQPYLDEYNLDVLKDAMKSVPEYRIQLHQRSTCSGLKGYVLSSEIMDSVNCVWRTPAGSEPRCCQVASYMSNNEIIQEGEGYLVVAFNLSDPYAMVVSADVPRIIKRVIPAQNSSTNESANTTSDSGPDVEVVSSQPTTPDEPATKISATKTAPSVAPSSGRPGLRERSPSFPRAASPASSVDMDTSPDNHIRLPLNTFALGNRIDSLDTRYRRWHTALGHHDGSIVIGVAEETTTPHSCRIPQKRRRVHEE